MNYDEIENKIDGDKAKLNAFIGKKQHMHQVSYWKNELSNIEKTIKKWLDNLKVLTPAYNSERIKTELEEEELEENKADNTFDGIYFENKESILAFPHLINLKKANKLGNE